MIKLGKAFSDAVIEERRSSPHKVTDPKKSWWLGAGRVLIFTTTLVVLFFILTWRLFELTVVQGRHFRALADGNRIRELIRHAPRGNLFDRTGKPLTQNLAQYRLITPCENGGSGCVKRLTQEEGAALVAKGLPGGTYLEVDYERTYKDAESIAHVVGFTGELTQEELEDEYYSLRKYRLGDRVGRVGAEAVYENLLRGRDGRELVEVDASGAILRTLGIDRELPGEDVTLSIDSDIASVVRSAFPEGHKGAVIVAKPTTGEILALYSAPSYSPNKFSLGISEGEYDALVNNPDRPMFDRAIGGVYPPASTFKIVTAIAGLEEGAVTPDTIVEDTGVINIGPFSFPNWYFLQYGKTEGPVDLVKALARSNDIYFYKLGEWTGITNFVKWANLMGVGRPLGIELGGEASGLMPDPVWKNERFNTPADLEARNNEWYLGDTYHASIGQGYVLTTPLQVNTWTNVVAASGKRCKPTIIKLPGPAGQNAECTDVGIQEETLTVVTEGMRQACATGGTAFPFFDFGITRQEATDSALTTKTPIGVACKTGTAEFGDPNSDATHAWFTVFAPIEMPEISVTVLVEAAGEGSYEAAPVAKKILEAWFSR